MKCIQWQQYISPGNPQTKHFSMILDGNCMEPSHIQKCLNKRPRPLTILLYVQFAHIWRNLIQNLIRHASIPIVCRSRRSPPSFFSKISWLFFFGSKFLLPTIGISFANPPVVLPDSWSVWPSDLLSGWKLQLVAWTYFASTDVACARSKHCENFEGFECLWNRRLPLYDSLSASKTFGKLHSIQSTIVDAVWEKKCNCLVPTSTNPRDPPKPTGPT